jgi:branched-chain amino acid transport system permease protein
MNLVNPYRRYVSKKLAVILIIIGIYLVLPIIFRGEYMYRVLTYLALFTVFSMSFSLLYGKTNQLFLCIAALAGISAYTSGLLTLNFGLNVWATFIISPLASAGTAALLSYITNLKRLGVIYVGVVTLAFQMIFETMVTGLVSITGGETGFRPPRLPLESIYGVLGESLTFYYLSVIVATCAVLLTYILYERSRFGLLMEAVRQEELAAEILGINTKLIKIVTAALAGFFIGVAGVIYGYYNQLISPAFFSFFSIDILSQVMAVAGSNGTILGPVIGAIVFIYLNEYIRFLGPISLSVYGLLLVILFSTFRNGIVLFIRRWIQWLP